MCPAQVSIQGLWILCVDLGADIFPDLRLKLGWAGKQQVVDVHREKLKLLREPKRTLMTGNWNAA